MKTIRNLDTSSYARMIFTSDIHGNYKVFKGLLEKIGYNPEKDALFIAGDLLFKGDENLKTLRYIIELSKKGNVHAVTGNCDGHWKIVRDTAYQGELINAKNSSRPNIIQDMCIELGFNEINQEDTDKVIALLEENFKEELDYIQNIPHIIEADNFILTHDGLRSDDRNLWAEEDSEKINSFMDTELIFDKYVIVGHWPVDNYRRDKQSLVPVINHDKKIISLDGGNVIKNAGQLNCIIIHNNDFRNIQADYYDLFPFVTVKSPQESSAEPYYLKWPENEIEIIEKGKEFSLCRQISSGYEMEIPNEYTFTYEGKTFSYDISDYEISAEKSDKVGLIKKFTAKSLVKKDGVVGWLDNECIEFSQHTKEVKNWKNAYFCILHFFAYLF